MSNFTPTVKYETDFDDDHIVMELSRLKRKGILKISPFLAGGVQDDGTIKMSFEDQAQMATVMAEILPEHIRNFEGLKDADGNSINIDTVIDEAYFRDLVGEIMGVLFRISKPSENEVKNSERKPEDSSKSDNTATTEQSPASAVAIG